MEECIFCKIVKGEAPCTKIYENDNFVCIKNINPLSEGHALVVPKKHFKVLLDLPSSLGNELIDCLKNSVVEMMKLNKFEGFNVILNNGKVAGQVVEHLHFHILPRREGDGLKGIV